MATDRSSQARPVRSALYGLAARVAAERRSAELASLLGSLDEDAGCDHLLAFLRESCANGALNRTLAALPDEPQLGSRPLATGTRAALVAALRRGAARQVGELVEWHLLADHAGRPELATAHGL